MLGFGKKNHRTVLVADDDDFIVGIITGFLDAENLTCLPAADGEEAVRIAREKRPDLILLDAGMPRMDGWQVLEELGSFRETADIPVLMCTADDLVSSLDRAFRSKAKGYIIKPVRREELLMKVRKALGLRAE